MAEELKYILWLFRQKYGEPALAVASSGRINIIGEHVDYNHGFVLPAAVNYYVWGVFAPSTDGCSHIFAANLMKSISFDIEHIREEQFKYWTVYIIGVIRELQKRSFKLGNFNLVFGGNVPIGAGLSSSAALENCLVYGLNKLFDLGLERKDMIFISQKAEHNYAGVRCGIMDQFASMFGRRNKAIFLDVESLDYEYVDAITDEYRFVVVNSNVKHSLVSSEYNLRREQSHKALEKIRKLFTDVKTYRDVTKEMLEQAGKGLEETEFRRARYIVEEIERTRQARDALAKGDVFRLAELLNETHAGLRDMYEVSCQEIDFLVQKALEHPAVIGSRLMGAGFGGSTLNILGKDAVEDFEQFITEQYYGQFTFRPEVYVVHPVDGTQEIDF